MKRGYRFFLLAAIAELMIIGFCIVRAGIGYGESKTPATIFGMKEGEIREDTRPESLPVSGEGSLAQETEPPMAFDMTEDIQSLGEHDEETTTSETAAGETAESEPDDISSEDAGDAAEGEVISEPTVRIRLTVSDYSSEYHDYVTISCDGTFKIEAEEKAQIFTGGQTVTIHRDHPFFQYGSIRVVSESGRMQIDSIAHRGQVNIYPGILDLYLTEQGIVIVNELGIEAYVERVVPSEMPAAYGAEAARLQAVCARTYAYQRLMAEQYDTYGAIANDSTDNQVYNASLAKEVSSQATLETRGIVLTFQGEPIVPYYFSTSCGFNTDNTVWGNSPLLYLRTQNLSYRGDIDLQTEQVFRDFILNWDYPAYEDDCTWYRWNYTITMDELKNILIRRLPLLLAESPGSFRAVTAEGTECAVDTEILRGLHELAVTSRLGGGMAREVAMVCDAGTIYATKEMILRRLFGNPARIYSNRSSEGFGESEGNYLPSAFFCPVANYEQSTIASYTFCGGGNGHGVGLSQNAAYAMLQSGLTWREVLQFFYLGTSLVAVY